MKDFITKLYIKLFQNESGASAAEYALILAIVGVALAAAASLLGSSIATAMNNTSAIINP